MSPAKQIDKLLEQATEIALAEIERRAKKLILQGKADEFLMGNGTLCFYRKGEPVRGRDGWSSPKWQQPFNDFVAKYDECLHLTGCPLTVYKDGSSDRKP